MGEWVLLLNNDTVPLLGFLYNMLKVGQKGYGIVGAKLLYPNDTIQHCGVGFTLDFWPIHLACRQPSDFPFANQYRRCACVTFACALIRRDVIRAVGGFDEQFWCSYEDVDYCLRAKEAGIPIAYASQAELYHKEAQTVGRMKRDKEMLGAYSRKWIETGRIYSVLDVWPIRVQFVEDSPPPSRTGRRGPSPSND